MKSIILITFFFIFFLFSPTKSINEEKILPYFSNFTSSIIKIEWAGTFENKVKIKKKLNKYKKIKKNCNNFCKDICSKNSLGENCMRVCGCVLGRNIIYILLKNGKIYKSEDSGKIWNDELLNLKKSFEQETKLNKKLNNYKSEINTFIINEIIIKYKFTDIRLILLNILKSIYNPDYIWILGNGYINWLSQDGGKTYDIWYLNDIHEENIHSIKQYII